MDFWRGWPYPVAVAVLFGIVLLRAGATYALGRAAGAGAQRTRLAKLMARPRFAQMERRVDNLEGEVEAFDLGRGKTLAEEISDLVQYVSNTSPVGHTLAREIPVEVVPA